jgi:Tfp pilus assembly protein PilF
MGLRSNLEAMLERGQDSALLRYSLGMDYLKAGQAETAVDHLQEAVRMDPDYSAAWKLLGKARQAIGATTEAAAAWRRGIEVARGRGDEQAAREMAVFLRRLERQHDTDR